VARDRKRAKQRRDRSAAVARRTARASADGAAPGAQATAPEEPDHVDGRAHAPGTIERADLPGALEHVGSEDEFDAAIVRGAGGVVAPDPVTDAPDPIADAPDHLSEEEIEAEDEAEDALQEPSGPGGGGAGGTGGGGGRGGGGGDGGHEARRPSGAPLRGGNRAIGFLGASWAELQRVQWPDRRQVTQATAVVLGFVTIAGVYLGVADTVAKEIVEFIL
jgi:preprotein translocase SecE subunit